MYIVYSLYMLCLQDMYSYSIATVNTYVHVQSMACLSFCNLCEQAPKHIFCTACDTGALLEPTKIQELTTAWNWLTFRTLDPAWMLPNKMTNLLCVLILYDVNLRFLPFFWGQRWITNIQHMQPIQDDVKPNNAPSHFLQLKIFLRRCSWRWWHL